jgi:hypothetical protein
MMKKNLRKSQKKTQTQKPQKGGYNSNSTPISPFYSKSSSFSKSKTYKKQIKKTPKQK